MLWRGKSNRARCAESCLLLRAIRAWRLWRTAPVKADDIAGLVKLAKEIKADLVVIGPEDPLALGLADALGEQGIKAFGPCRAAVQLEADKAFSKTMRDNFHPHRGGAVIQ